MRGSGWGSGWVRRVGEGAPTVPPDSACARSGSAVATRCVIRRSHLSAHRAPRPGARWPHDASSDGPTCQRTRAAQGA
eukprot:1194044-Prorocentrum_minimum.AAC.4